MADEAIELAAIDGLQGTELMGRPLRINKAEPRGSGGARRGEEVAGGGMAVVIIMAATAATAVVIIVVAMAVAMAVVIIMAATAVVAVVIIMAATAVATTVVILNLIPTTPINLLEQMVGKIEVMETLLKTLNMKVVGVGEKGEFRMIVILQSRKISNPFLLAF